MIGKVFSQKKLVYRNVGGGGNISAHDDFDDFEEGRGECARCSRQKLITVKTYCRRLMG